MTTRRPTFPSAIGEELELFLVTAPGLESVLEEEAAELGFTAPERQPGGVTIRGDWADVMRANLFCRTASRVLVRLARFPALHPAQLDKRARKVPWGRFLPRGVAVRVDAECRASRIYHKGAAAERVARAITDATGAAISRDAEIRVLVRIERNLCTLSIDTSGSPLHLRGHKHAVAKAPMRENLAAAFLRMCGYRGDEPLVDPMCGSGTFVIEAAEMAAGLAPGRSRRFAFEALVPHDPDAWKAMKDTTADRPHEALPPIFGADRDPGAVRAAAENARRAGVAGSVAFRNASIAALQPPSDQPGLVIVNPPYGSRIGNRDALFGLYASFGRIMRERFSGWRVGLVTSQPKLAAATGLDLTTASAPIDHGGIAIRLHVCGEVR
ncbi:MAG: class I SAM-dependent RNA methyltransferase [Alphaproteobacteria bacterium]|nr:MAG: class I SAM-dependent RNA methyltransferase [Alphaproteobacteria bacterium]